MIGVCCGLVVMAFGSIMVVANPTAGVLVCVCGVAIISFDLSDVTCNTDCPGEEIDSE